MTETKATASPVIDLMDESFDSKKSNTYHLSILSSGNNFSFTVLDTNSNKYLVLKSDKSTMEFFENNFKSVTCAVSHNKFALIPSALFDEEKKESLLGFNHPAEKDETIYFNTMRNLDAKNLFVISKELETSIKKQFPNVKFIHHSTSFIEGLLVQHKNNSGKKVFADFTLPLSSGRGVGGEVGYFTVAILNGRELVFSNSFTYLTAEDVAYYILFVYEQMHLNTEETELVLSGSIEKNAKEHSLLYNYIRHVKFASLPNDFQYSYKLEEIPSHTFYSLFTQYLCV